MQEASTGTKLPLYRAWHAPTSKMYENIIGFAWSDKESPGETRAIVITYDEEFIEGNISEFTFMRKSTLSDGDGAAIFSGDILLFTLDSRYPNELFVVVDHEDGLYANKEGIFIPLICAVCTHGAKVVGNIIQDKFMIDGEGQAT